MKEWFKKLKECWRLFKKIYHHPNISLLEELNDNISDKESLEIYKSIQKSKDKTKILEIAETLSDMEKCIILFSNNKEDKEHITFYTNDDELDIEYTRNCKELIRDTLNNILTPQIYDRDLEYYEPYTALAFKEAEYQVMRADMLEAELAYYKAINDPNGPAASQTYALYERYMNLKERLEKFEKENQIN
jgi:hypothetical protein